MTTLPKRPDGRIDWENYMPKCSTGIMRTAFIEIAQDAYIAALERCAEWHDGQAKAWRNIHSSCAEWEEKRRDTIRTHEVCADTIRRWIEEEKGK